VGTEDHLPFGEEAGVIGESEKHRFTSYERDSESNTDYAMNRQCGMSTGKFMRPDPIGGKLNNPQSWNRYSYAQNDPANFSDPSGLYICDATVASCGGAFGGGFGMDADFWGDRIVDLPGFGSQWGSMSGFYEQAWSRSVKSTIDAAKANEAIKDKPYEEALKIAFSFQADNPDLSVVDDDDLEIKGPPPHHIHVGPRRQITLHFGKNWLQHYIDHRNLMLKFGIKYAKIARKALEANPTLALPFLRDLVAKVNSGDFTFMGLGTWAEGNMAPGYIWYSATAGLILITTMAGEWVTLLKAGTGMALTIKYLGMTVLPILLAP